MKKICENQDNCNVIIPKKRDEVLKYNQVQKFIKIPFIVYADSEHLIEKMHTCKNN